MSYTKLKKSLTLYGTKFDLSTLRTLTSNRVFHKFVKELCQIRTVNQIPNWPQKEKAPWVCTLKLITAVINHFVPGTLTERE
jgi:hypothetical protein